MKRPVRNEEDGMYHIKGTKYPELFGSRTQVMNKSAYKTSGNLTKDDLMMNKWGRIVSAKKHKTAKKEKRLEKAGYYAKKGKFGYVKRKTRKNKSQKKMKGGDWVEDLMKRRETPEGQAEQARLDKEAEEAKKAKEEEAAKKAEDEAEAHREFQKMADEAAAKHQAEQTEGGKKKNQKKKVKGGDHRDCATKEEMAELVEAMGEEKAKEYAAHKGMKPCDQ